VFSILGILQHYVEFDTHTIVTLEKLLNVGSFGGFINNLIRCSAILSVSLNELGLLSVVQTTTHAFLGCWAIIFLAFVTRFQ
jgi:hypothetical protein